VFKLQSVNNIAPARTGSDVNRRMAVTSKWDLIFWESFLWCIMWKCKNCGNKVDSSPIIEDIPAT
jgi:hypothetical protein